MKLKLKMEMKWNWKMKLKNEIENEIENEYIKAPIAANWGQIRDIYWLTLVFSKGLDYVSRIFKY